jgi:hypothetical protein
MFLVRTVYVLSPLHIVVSCVHRRGPDIGAAREPVQDRPIIFGGSSGSQVRFAEGVDGARRFWSGILLKLVRICAGTNTLPALDLDNVRTLSANHGRAVSGRIRVVDNVEQNRMQIFSPGISAESIRQDLKSDEFSWSPTAAPEQSRSLSRQANAQYFRGGSRWSLRKAIRSVPAGSGRF